VTPHRPGEVVVNVISEEHLRRNLGELLRRVEGGEEFIVVVDDRPVALLEPMRPRNWVSGPELRRVWATPTSGTGDDRTGALSHDLNDPFS
jgi:antitoxin (DNA-binding transcriptional repressor) of toxin-antitoxin stability system